MACLQQLTVRYLRNLNATSLALDSRQNVLYGRNGSGKTSLLEAIYILGAAKSFRAKHLRHVVQKGQEGLRIQAGIERPGQSADHPGRRACQGPHLPPGQRERPGAGLGAGPLPPRAAG